jgi:hypothetical protein
VVAVVVVRLRVARKEQQHRAEEMVA